MKTKIVYYGIFIFILLYACKRDTSSNCPNAITTYSKNIDTTNLPYKLGKTFTYIDKNGDSVVTKIISDTIYYNCILQNVSIADCGTQNTNCYINKGYKYDALSSVRLDTYSNKLFIVFNGTPFAVFVDALINPNVTFYPFIKDMVINNKNYSNVRLVTNSNNDTLYINYNVGILKVINGVNKYTLK